MTDEDPSLLTPHNQYFLRQLELTVAPRTSKPGSIEALIDDLMEYNHDPYGYGLAPAVDTYGQLVDLGFDAVPALIAHVQDDRLSRAMFGGLNNFRPYHLTVGHLCSRLLYDLSARTIDGSVWELRGDRLDAKPCERWYAEAKRIGEENWLVDHAVPADNGQTIVNQRGRAETLIGRVIAIKYPHRLPAIYRAMLKKPDSGWLHDHVDQIVASKLPREEKLALFEEGVRHPNAGHRCNALSGLGQLSSPLFRDRLRVELREVSARLEAGEAWTPAMDRFTGFVFGTDDRECWDLLLTITKRLPVGDRSSMLHFAEGYPRNRPPDPNRLERLRFLLQFLGDHERIYDDDEMKYEMRDAAAYHLAGLLGVKMRRHPHGILTPYPDRGPLSRLFFREMLRELATREVAKNH
jgi:hypothetical protein